MLDNFLICVIVGTVLGFLAGLGVGGGSLLILWLTVVLGTDHPTARFINLLFFLPAALVSAFFRWKQGCIDPEKVIPAAISGCVAALLFSWIASMIDLSALKKLFGGLLLVTGLRELFYRPRKAK